MKESRCVVCGNEHDIHCYVITWTNGKMVLLPSCCQCEYKYVPFYRMEW